MILLPWAPTNPADGSWSPLEQRGERGEHQKPVAGAVIAPRGSAGEERLTPRWRLRSRAHCAIAVDVNLLRADLRVMAEQSVAPEQQVTCMQSDVDTLKASVDILKAKTRKLEHGTGRSRMMGQKGRNPCGGRVVGDSARQRKCVLQRAEVPDTIVPAMEAK
ncbi:hypothetical protein NDU88_003905 [Pleurodeles waltl]|uniref:Uncharacterized protein n=1 Tax=Pleurodeles waltl TaxID=8319 RepID=A0AAV7M6D7_PLEWA|nr:hypothetical protein NDU88_003905 [Pleurodeles waltl]